MTRDRDILDRIIGTAETLAPLLTATRTILNAQHDCNDGYPTIASGANTDGRGGQRTITVNEPCTGWRRGKDLIDLIRCPIEGEHTHPEHVPVTSVEAAALNRTNTDHTDNEQLDAELHAALQTLTNLTRDCRHIIGPHLTPTPKPRCDGGTGRDGHLQWGRPDCTNIPDTGRKLCHACRQRMTRWRKQHNLPTQTDGMYQ